MFNIKFINDHIWVTDQIGREWWMSACNDECLRFATMQDGTVPSTPTLANISTSHLGYDRAILLIKQYKWMFIDPLSLYKGNIRTGSSFVYHEAADHLYVILIPINLKVINGCVD